MDYEIKHLRCFVAIAHDRSFTRAAARLHMSQPALSLQIKELEKRLGLSLLHRSTRHVELTNEGTLLLTEAERVIEESDRLKLKVQTLRKQSQGVLKLGAAFYTIDIAERVGLIERFMAEHPTARLDVQTKWQVELMEAMATNRLDLAVVIGRPVEQDQTLQSRRGELVFPAEFPRVTLRSERIELLVPIELDIARMDSIPVERLKGVKVALMGAYHGDIIVGPLKTMLANAGAQPFTPPEGNAVAVERYGRQFRIPAMTMGWFGQDPRLADMVRRPIKGFNLNTELALLSNADKGNALAHEFFRLASHWSGLSPTRVAARAHG
jgi:hypothetical protein